MHANKIIRLNGQYWKYLTNRKTAQLIREIGKSETRTSSPKFRADKNEGERETEEGDREESVRSEEQMYMDARMLVIDLLREASSYPSRATYALAKIAELLEKYSQLTKWLICLEPNGIYSWFFIALIFHLSSFILLRYYSSDIGLSGWNSRTLVLVL